MSRWVCPGRPWGWGRPACPLPKGCPPSPKVRLYISGIWLSHCQAWGPHSLIPRDLGTSVSSETRTPSQKSQNHARAEHRWSKGAGVGQQLTALPPEVRRLLMRGQLAQNRAQSRAEPRTGDPGVMAPQPLANVSAQGGCWASDRKIVSAVPTRGTAKSRAPDPAGLLVRGLGKVSFPPGCG